MMRKLFGLDDSYMRADHESNLEIIEDVYDVYLDEDEGEPLVDRWTFSRWLLERLRSAGDDDDSEDCNK